MQSVTASFPRQTTPIAGYRRLLGTLFFLIALNIVDAFSTLFWVNAGMATEANPLMNQLLLINATTFLVGKGILAVGGSILLWKFRGHPLSNTGAILATSVYSVVCLYHFTAFLIFQV